jgi:hypothetical protein
VDTAAYHAIPPPTQNELHSLTTTNRIGEGSSGLLFPLLVDGGAAGTTCHDKTCLHEYKVLSRYKYFNDAGKTTHRAIGEGYLCLEVCMKGEKRPSHFMVHSYHTPTIPITVLSPGRTVLRHPKRFDAHTVYTNHVTGKGYAQFHGMDGNSDTQIPGIILDVLVYAQAIRPASMEHACNPIMFIQE